MTLKMHCLVGVVCLTTLAMGMPADKANAYPVAKRRVVTRQYAQGAVSDAYSWLEGLNLADTSQNPDIMAYINEENAFTEQHLEPFKPLEDRVFEEFKSRRKDDDASYPYAKGAYEYTSRFQDGKQYRMHYRKRMNDPDAQEELYFDENTVQPEGKYVDVHEIQVSPCENTLAFSMDVAEGNEVYDIFSRDLSGLENVLEVEDTTGSIIWAQDCTSFYYLKQNDVKQSNRLFRHVLGASTDQLLFEERDPMFSVGIAESSSERLLFCVTSSSTTSEVRFLDLRAGPSAPLKLVQERQPGILYSVEHVGDSLLILTDGVFRRSFFSGKQKLHRFINSRIMITPIKTPEQQHWKGLVPYSSALFNEGMEVFADRWLVVYGRKDGLQSIRLIDLQSRNKRGTFIEVPGDLNTLSAYHSHQEYKSNTFRFQMSSMTQPTTLYEMNFLNGKKKVLDVKAVPNYNSELYTSRRIFAPIKKGTLVKEFKTPDVVPVSLLYRKDLFAQKGPKPLILYGYGSYGMSMDPNFSQTLFSYIDRGFVYAIAHVRGGAEYGKTWFESGRLQHKVNSFHDFISAADHLVAEGFSTPSLMTIMGSSAGGLLMGAVVNMRPDIAKLCVAGVPFVDALNTMENPDLPLTINEYEQWGNPNDPKVFKTILGYSPYDNIQPGVRYPNMFVRSGLNDPRVAYHEPTKWVAKLRYMDGGADQDHILLDMSTKGHFGESGRDGFLRYKAREYAYVIGTILPGALTVGA